MSTAHVSPERKALNYAESLGLNEVYEAANRAHDRLAAAQRDATTARQNKRLIEERMQEREMDLIIDESAKHPGMSVAAMERHLKVVIHTDEQMRDMKVEARAQASELDLAESTVRSSEAEVRIAVARMTELGGYFTYLAAVKSAKKAREAEQSE